jgi:3-phenylpropionate/trans-cinnamate dioxygenase ferredoxin subunit
MFNYTQYEPEKCEFIKIGSLDSVPEGERLYLEIDQFSLVVFNVAGKLFAISNICSHDDHPLGDGELVDHEISCPRHGARFDIRNGKAVSLPAIVDIPAYPVRIVGGEIEIGIPLENS